MYQELEIVTPRDIVEDQLMVRFPAQLRPLDESCIPDINRNKNGDFAFSYMGLSLYGNGHNVLSKSTNFPRGMLYKDKDAIFGVGVFFREKQPVTPCINIVAPRGENWVAAVDKFTRTLREFIPEAEIFVRDLTYEQYAALKPQLNLDRLLDRRTDSLWTAIEANPWVRKSGPPDETWATQEDATFHGALVDLDHMLRDPKGGMFNNAEWLSPNQRSKKRHNYKSFEHFLDRHGLEYVLEKYTPAMEDTARTLVTSHFDELKKDGKAVGSTAADYENIITCDSERIKEARLHMYMGFIRKKGDDRTKIPVSFFGLEEVGKDAVASYATITSYDPARLQSLVKSAEDDKEAFKGFYNIAVYATGQLMHEMKNKGMRWFNMGGSETKDLDLGKRGLGARGEPTYWAVSNRNGAPKSHSL